MDRSDDDDLLGVAEVALMLGVSRKTLTRMVKEGKFPRPINYGGLSRWRKKVVRDWLRAMEVLSTLEFFAGSLGTLPGSFGTSGDMAETASSNLKKPR